MQETRFLVWTGAMGLAPTNPVNVVLADTQEAVNNVSCWLFHGAVVWPVGGPKVQSSWDPSLKGQRIYGASFLSFSSEEQVVKVDLLWQWSRKSSWQPGPLGRTHHISKHCLSPCSPASTSRANNMYNLSTQDSCASSKKTLCKFHSCRHLCERVTVQEIASEEIWIWMASISPVVNLQSHTEF